MGKGRSLERVKWTDFHRTLSTVPAFPEAVEIGSVSHEGVRFRQQWSHAAPEKPEKPKQRDQHRTDWENDYLLYTLLCRDKVNDHYSSRTLPPVAKGAKEVEPEVPKEEAVVEKLGEGPERSASIPTRPVADIESEWSRMVALEKFYDAHAADMATMEQVTRADPVFERLRRARSQRGAAVVPGQNNLSDLGIPGIEGEVGVKVRAPYVRGALEKARRATQQRRRADPEARAASEVKRAEQEHASSPSEMLGDPDASPKSQGSHVQFSTAKKEKQHKPRRVSIVASKEKVYVDTEKVVESPAMDLICAEEDGFVQLEKVADGTFRYEVRLANGRKVENIFDLFAENREDAEDGIMERQTKDVKKSEEKKGKIKKSESTLVADAVMKPSAQLRGNLGWDIEIFPNPADVVHGANNHGFPSISELDARNRIAPR